MNAIIDMPVLFQDQDIAFTFEAPALDTMQTLLVHGFEAREKLFGLTQVDIELVSEDPDIDLSALLDTPATLTIYHKYAGIRHLSGVIAEIARADEGFHRTFYTVTLLPMLHRLDHGSDCRIFQQKSVPDIIREILKENGVEDVQWHMAGEHVAREYCVQYRETHLAFIERIAAEEGIWYYFTYGENGQHTLHFIDMPQIVAKLPDFPELEYNANPGGAVKGVFCNRFAFHERLRSTAYTQRDYTFKNPPYNQEHKAERQEDNGAKRDYALYDYPGRYKRDVAGKPFTKYRMEATRTDATTADGQTNAIHLMPGFRMALTDHPNKACNIDWHLLSVSHSGEQPQALKEEAGSGATTYSASFSAMPARLPYRPRQTQKPMVDGPQIARVTGPEGEEIYCDEFARIKVWFPWDHRGEQNDKSSCWIRVANNWAGATWGHMAIPRIGQEVIVDFLEGDPDQPIVTGRTYNAMNKPPYKLPDNKTRMTIKSQTHKGNGYNELRFEDEKDQEEVYIHAQKDRNEKTKNNHTERIDNNWVQSVGHNKAIEVQNNHQEVIGGNMSLAVGPSGIGQIVNSVFQKLATGIGDVAKGLGIPGILNPGEGNMSVIVEKNKVESVGIFNAINVGASMGTNVGMTYNVSAGNAIGFVSNDTLSATATNTVIFNSNGEMHFGCGKAFILLHKDGTVTLTGTKLIFDFDEVEINGDKTVIINGGKVNIN